MGRDLPSRSQRLNCSLLLRRKDKHLRPWQRDLFQNPVLRSNNDGEHRHARWLELFYDLAFAAVLAQLTQQFSMHFDLATFARFTLVFVPVWRSWIGQTFYLTRFDSEDVGHTILTFLQIGCIAAMALEVQPALEGSAKGFFLCYSLIRFLLVLEYLRVAQCIPEARTFGRGMALGFSLAIGLWLYSVVAPAPLHAMIRIAAVIVEFSTPSSMPKLSWKLPPHFGHIPERMSQFTVVVIGEAVASSIVANGSTMVTPVAILVGMPALLLLFTTAWIYFEGVQAQNERHVRSHQDAVKFRLWMYLHLPVMFYLTALAAGIRSLLLRPTIHPTDAAGAKMILLTALAVNISLNALFLTRLNRPKIVVIWRQTLFMWLAPLVSLAAVPFAGNLDVPLLPLIPATATTAQIVVMLISQNPSL